MAERKKLLKRFELREFPQPDLVKLKYPVFMCHGYGAIGGMIKSGPMHDPCMKVRSHGVPAIAPNIVPYARIETRAKNWVRLINQFCEKYGCEKVNVIAHSMGGLDMRYALSKLDIADKVDSLTTLATPHHGSSLADLVLKAPDQVTEKLGEMFDWFGDNMYPKTKSDALGSLEQLTCAFITNIFNPETPDKDGVAYYSYSAAVGKGTEYSLNPMYKFQNNHIYDKEGPNDAFVSIESAHWGTHIETVPLSHLAQMHVQMNKESDRIYQQFWQQVLERLAESGH
ncbi:esterase/lipase family protein [Gracilimonas mengyeensis]|uniref:Triacylglycerol lipase n=1 Tax=Gracilimonas mengyeensis TaxID=1302730 RepID=A0A521BFT0_9BACT|nr:alpha/beta fold hydrolase [Gracilimonas mengyeensis]SMO45922.1 triacylglycerol lipase [Gracilimonas mengyeensis]